MISSPISFEENHKTAMVSLGPNNLSKLFLTFTIDLSKHSEDALCIRCVALDVPGMFHAFPFCCQHKNFF